MDALKENHSPELQFLPDNDTDDYTMAVVMINETRFRGFLDLSNRGANL